MEKAVMTIPDLSKLGGTSPLAALMNSNARMPMNEINGNENKLLNEQPLKEGDKASFGKTLENFVQDVNGLQKDSAHQSERFLKGEAVDVHDVMIAAEKAKTSFQLLMELRNKTLDVYKEATRIQI